MEIRRGIADENIAIEMDAKMMDGHRQHKKMGIILQTNNDPGK